MVKITFIILILILSFEISSQVQINISAKTPCSKEIKLSDIIDNINYISLETKRECLIGSLTEIRFTDNFFFVKNHLPPSLFQFDCTGRFITNIGKQGKGPGEFNRLRSFCIDEGNKNVILYAKQPDKLLIYEFDGNLNKTVFCPDDQPVNEIESFSNDNYVLMFANYNGKTKHSYQCYSMQNTLLTKAIIPKSFSRNGSFSIMPEFSFYTYNNSLNIKENILNDTIYTIVGTNFIPKYVLNFGKNTFPIEARQERITYLKNMHEYFIMKNIFESKNYLILIYRFNKEIHVGFYHKNTKTTCLMKNDGIINDFDGGVSFKPIYQRNNILIGFIEAYALIAHVNSKAFINSTPKYPEKKKALEELANSLNENDNPVLMLVKLKE
jgi:hypothetical protein